jgi:hypothetical protein
MMILLQRNKKSHPGSCLFPLKQKILMMILLQQNKRRRDPGEKCHARTMMHSKPAKLST